MATTPQYCYIIYSPSKNRTYVGYTVEPTRRIRQHNGIIKGGAKATSITNDWRFLSIITSSNPKFTNILALSIEWHLKHPSGKRRDLKYHSGVPKLSHPERVENSWQLTRVPQCQKFSFANCGTLLYSEQNDTVRFKGIDGRLRAIIEVLNRYSIDLTVYVDEIYRVVLEGLRDKAELNKDLSNPESNVIYIKTLNELLEGLGKANSGSTVPKV